MAESAAKIGQNLPRAMTDQSILPMYVTLLGDAEPEVRSEAASNLPLLSKNCSSHLILTKVLPGLKL